VGSMWYLLEDFFDQGIIIQGFLALGWLCMIVMVCSIVAGFF